MVWRAGKVDWQAILYSLQACLALVLEPLDATCASLTRLHISDALRGAGVKA